MADEPADDEFSEALTRLSSLSCDPDGGNPLLPLDSDTADEPAAAGTRGPRQSSELQCQERTELGGLGEFDVLGSITPAANLTAKSRAAPVDRARWDSFFNAEGVLLDEVELRKALFEGGAVPEIRRQAWFLLLGHRSPDPASAEQFYKNRTTAYEDMKVQWEKVSERQLMNHKGLKERLERVAKDVARTDREDGFFAGDENPNLEVLNDILCTWCMYNYDLGYVQVSVDSSIFLRHFIVAYFRSRGHSQILKTRK